MNNREKKIIALTMHVGQHVEGHVRGFVSALDKQYKVDLTLTELGVLIHGKITDKLIPFANIQGIDFEKNAQ